MIVLCLASSTTPRRNLLVALEQYTVTHFRLSSTKSSLWFLSSLLLNRGLLNRGSTVVQFIQGKKASFPIPVLQAPVVQTLDSAIHRINRYPAMLSNCVIEWIEIYPVESAIHLLNSLRAADVFPVVASLPPKKASPPRRLPFQQLGRDWFVVTHALVTKTNFLSD